MGVDGSRNRDQLVGPVQRTTSGSPESSLRRTPIARARRSLIALAAVTSAAAVVGGLLLVAAPDGSLLAADPAALTGSPFTSWRAPGLRLLSLVGGGFALAAVAVLRRFRYAAELTTVAGAGLVAFEMSEWFWLGFQVLELIFLMVGLQVVRLALRIRRWSGRSPVAGARHSQRVPPSRC